MGVSAEPVRPDSHSLQEFLCPLLSPAGGSFWLVGVESVKQMLSHRHQRIKAGHWILKNQTYRFTTQLPQSLLLQWSWILAGQ